MAKMTEEQVKRAVRTMDELVTGRANFDTMNQDIAEITYPEHANFTFTSSPGEKRMSKVYDSVGIHSNQLLSSGLFSLLTSPASPWASLMPVDMRLWDIHDVQVHLNDRRRIMFHEINKASAGFSTAMHEAYLSYGAFGQLCVFATEIPAQASLSFVALPIYDCYFIENQYGQIDTMFRKYKRTVEFLVRKFGKEKLSTQTQQLASDSKLKQLVDCLHIIMPREVYDIYGIASTDMPFLDVYIEKDQKHVIQEKGFHEISFFAARFYKESFETYGRGPGSTALPDNRMLQRVAQVTIRAAQKATDPALLLPNSGFLRPLRTTPGGLNYYKKGRVNVKDDIGIVPTGNPGLGIEFSASLHERIREAFFVDQLQLQAGPQMTATEVLQRTEEKLRLMGPLFGRVQTELLGPMIRRIDGLLSRAGKYPPVPLSLNEQPLKIVYTSPIARAQEQVQANGLVRAFQVLDPLIKMDETIMDNFNTDEMSKGVFDMFSIDPSFLNDQKVVDKIRADRAAAEKAKQDAENLRASGQGVDSMARAGQTMDEMGMDIGDFGTLQ